MSNELAIPTPSKRTKPSTLRTLLQAVALAAVLVPLGTVAVETASVTCGFGSGSYGGSYCNGGIEFTATEDTSRFDFGDYYLELMFTGISDFFEVTVNTTTGVSLMPLEGPSPFPGYECIAMSATHGCVDFQVNTYEAKSGTDWLKYKVAIDWASYPNDVLEPGMEPRIRILHDSSKAENGGAELAGNYDFDMCLGGDYDACDQVSIEPRIRSGDTDFDSFLVALAPATPVPEPSSLLLLGTGAGAALYRKRRRSKV